MEDRRVDWRKRAGIEAKGMERNCVGLLRPVSGPRRGWVKVRVWVWGMDIMKVARVLQQSRVLEERYAMSQRQI
jgi:hypothetical protein